MSGHVVDAHLMFIKSMHEHNLAGLKDRERGKETERATFPSEQSIFQNKVLTVFLDDVVGPESCAHHPGRERPCGLRLCPRSSTPQPLLAFNDLTLPRMGTASIPLHWSLSCKLPGMEGVLFLHHGFSAVGTPNAFLPAGFQGAPGFTPCSRVTGELCDEPSTWFLHTNSALVAAEDGAAGPPLTVWLWLGSTQGYMAEKASPCPYMKLRRGSQDVIRM